MTQLQSNQARFTLSIDGSDAVWTVVQWRAAESLGGLFELKVLVLSEAPVSPGALIGARASFAIGGAATRHLHGIVAAFAEGGRSPRGPLSEVTVVPAAWRLLHTADCRIFQERSVPQIITELLKEHGIEGERVRFELGAPHPQHDYCVQYRESDWAFVARLCEEEGITVYFDHKEAAHDICFTDHGRAYSSVDGDAAVPLRERGADGAMGEAVSTFWRTERMGSNAVLLHDYNFEHPAADLVAEAAPRDGGRERLEVYDFPGGHEDLASGRRSARLRLEELQWQQCAAQGRSTCGRLMPGRRFVLEDPDGALREELRQEYLVVSVTHRGEQVAALADGARTPGLEYENEFTAIPAAESYRPPRSTPRPIVRGVQTAMVVGPAGQEIYTDEHARVKVQFHWDRLGRRDERSSCWIRVSQAWAGAGYGFMAIPRIGHEVIVSFLEGDPDRPLITGRVYHGANAPPYELPGAATRTTLMSSSSPGGGGTNELRFEDAAGAEEVYLHGQRDLSINVENDKRQRVGQDEAQSIGRDRDRAVGRDERVGVVRDQELSVGGSQRKKVTRNVDVNIGGHRVEQVGGSRIDEVRGNATLDVVGDSATEVVGNMTLTVVQTKTEQVLLGSNEMVGLAKGVEVGGAFSTSVVGPYTVNVVSGVDVQAGQDIEQRAGKRVAISASTQAVISAGDDLSLSAAKSVNASADKTFTVSAGDEVTLTCGDAVVVLKKNGDVVVKGKKVTVEGSGDVVVKGSKVRIN